MRKTLLTSLALMLVAGTFASPRTAHAQWAVIDPVNLIQNTFSVFFAGEDSLKEFVLDPLARLAAEQVRRALIESIINWANSGFEGSPAFVTNIEENLRGLSDYVADSFMAELQASGVIGSPFRDVLVRELRESYRRMTSDSAFFETNRYTLDQYTDDSAAFLGGDFSQGGIRGWIHAWMNPQNNPLGAYGAARRELESRIAGALGNRRDEINRNSGFLDFCSSPPAEEGGATSLRPAVVGCRPGDTVRTLGSLTHEQIGRAVGSDIDMIVSADELDELFVAVANGLMRRMFDDGGFSGLSGSSSGGGGSENTGALSPGNLRGAIDGQIHTLSQYRDNWQTIQAAIIRAEEACETGGDAVLRAEVEAAQAQATAALSTVGGLLNELQAIKTKLSATGASAEQSVREGTAEYQALLASGRLPGVAALSFASVQSQDAERLTPPTLRMRMNEIANSFCRD